MARIAFVLPPDQQARLGPHAIRHGHEIVARCSSADDFLDSAASVSVDVVLAAATESCLPVQLLAACDDRGIRLLPLTSGDVERRRVSSLGLLESVDAGASWPEIERELAIFLGREEAPSSSQPETGRVIAVWGPAGSPGRTTLAVNLAAELATSGRSVALADADTYSGSVAPTLGMLDEAPGFAAACRLAGSDSLTHAELERVGSRYGSGKSAFWVLSGIGRPSRWPELSEAKVTATIQQCRTWAQFTVIDTGFSLERDEEIVSDQFAPRRNAATLAALGEADHIVAVGAADPVGLSRFLRAHVDLVESVPADRIRVAMNKVRASAIGMNPHTQVAQTLARFGRIDSVAMIPFDQPALDAALLTGRTLADAAPRSPARTAIRELATRLTDTR